MSDNKLFAGARVQTPLGDGSVLYVRMSAPEYTRVVAVSVYLDSRRSDPFYRGTIFASEKVTCL